MAEYIEREAAKRHLVSDYAYAAAKMLDDIPAADVAPVVHGRWDNDHKCTVCRKEALCEEKPDYYAHGLLTLFYVDSNYCPNCGAKMDLQGE